MRAIKHPSRGLPRPCGAAMAPAMENYEPEWLLFAGNATWGAIWGAVLLALAGFAIWRDRSLFSRACCRPTL